MNKTGLATGGPAFPRPHSVDLNDLEYCGFTGMTLRDHFAGQVIGQAYMAAIEFRDDGSLRVPSSSEVAYEAYRIADAMLERREEK